MRPAAIAGAALLALLLAAGASAQDESALKTWAGNTGNRASVGLNNLLTAPADPVMFTIEGDEVFSDLWKPQVTGRVVGLFAGIFQMPYRMLTGTFDLCLSWVPYLRVVSPVPRFNLFPWAEHPDA